MTATALRSDLTWLRLPGYGVKPLNANLAGREPELKQALESGVYVHPDANRINFYDVELPTGWAYIHVRDRAKTVHLIAYSRQS